jgi:hypothetical protein
MGNKILGIKKSLSNSDEKRENVSKVPEDLRSQGLLY